MKEISRNIIIFLVMFSGAASALSQFIDESHELKLAKLELAKVLSYKYLKPEIFTQYPDDAYLPDGIFPSFQTEVIYHRYATKKHSNVRTDYFTQKNKFIIRVIQTYANNGDTRYLLYTDENNTLKWYVKKIPYNTLSKDVSRKIEVGSLEWLLFQGGGKLIHRDVVIYNTNHKNHTMKEKTIRYDREGAIQSEETRNLDYDSMMGIGH